MLEAAEAASFPLCPSAGAPAALLGSLLGVVGGERGRRGPPRPESAARRRRPGWARAPSGRAGPARRHGRRGAGCFPVASLISFPRLCSMI